MNAGRGEGEETDLLITIAGLTVRLLCEDARVGERLRASYGDFLSRDGSPVAAVEINVQPGVEFLPIKPGAWVVESSVQNQRLVFKSYFESGWVDLRRGWGELVMAPESSVENFLRVLYAHLGVEQGALLVHAAAVAKNDQAYVFFGPSGSGKTTVARFSSGHTILSDDMVFLRKVRGSVRAFGVPFRGELPESPRSNISAKVAGLYRLRKADRHFVSPLNPIRALGELVTCVPFVTTTPAMAERVMALAQDLIRSVPVRELHFRRDGGFWEVLE